MGTAECTMHCIRRTVILAEAQPSVNSRANLTGGCVLLSNSESALYSHPGRTWAVSNSEQQGGPARVQALQPGTGSRVADTTKDPLSAQSHMHSHPWRTKAMGEYSAQALQPGKWCKRAGAGATIATHTLIPGHHPSRTWAVGSCTGAGAGATIAAHKHSSLTYLGHGQLHWCRCWCHNSSSGSSSRSGSWSRLAQGGRSCAICNSGSALHPGWKTTRAIHMVLRHDVNLEE
eukprot:1161875-Pelagomonas_calceolata.AAC.11